MVYGKDSNFGKAGNLESVSYGEARAGQGSNPTLSATSFIFWVCLARCGATVGSVGKEAIRTITGWRRASENRFPTSEGLAANSDYLARLYGLELSEASRYMRQ